MRYNYNTAGQPRSLRSGYCGVRAVVIATGMRWEDAEHYLRQYAKRGAQGNGKISTGMYKQDFNAALEGLGWKWHSAPTFDTRKARSYDLTGTVIAQQAGHYVAVIDGVIQDIADCSERMVYGYWAEA